MKQLFLFATAALAISLASCGRHEANVDPASTTVKTFTGNPNVLHAAGRMVGAEYSKPIAIDSANKMINSYLQSVGYPYADTTIRSLSFDADTLRAYLANNNITTLKFYLGHQLGWLNGSVGRFGKNIGMQPGKLTIICVGLDNDGDVVRNTSNGVYEHAMPCPTNCGPSTSDAYLQ